MQWLASCLLTRAAGAVTVVCLAMAAGFAPLVPLLAAPPSHRAPVSADRSPTGDLAAACRTLPEDSLFWGLQRVEERRRELKDLVERNPDEALSGVARLEARIRLAGELLRQGGRTTEALTLLDRAADELPEDAPAPLREGLLLVRVFAHLQQAEDENCVEHHGAESCILPLAPEAIHRRPDHSRRAFELLRQYLEVKPADIQARWLLNLAARLAGQPEAIPAAHRLPPGAFDAETPFRRFRNRAPELGVEGSDLAGGAVVEDFDGDGLLDLVTSSFFVCDPLRAYRNDGRGGFEDVTRAWGLADQLGGLNLVQGDYDGDGHPDLLVLRGAWLADEGRIRNSLLRNRLHERKGFEDVTRAAGLAEPAYPTQTAAWADYDGDGDLDLYVGNEVRGEAVWPSSLYRFPGSYDLAPLLEGDRWTEPFSFVLRMMGDPKVAFPSQLFRNEGDGTFTDVAEEAGVTNRRFTKGVTWGDYDDDGDPDLFVSNAGLNRLYRNDGDGTFTDVAADAGVTEPSRLAFACWFFDVDNDGDLDLFVADFSVPVPTVAASYFGPTMALSFSRLFRNDGGGDFTDVSVPMGLARPILPMGAGYGDLDNDGFPDLVLGTGAPDLDAVMPNLALRNVAGKRFEDVTFAAGLGHLQKGHGVAFGDVDNDGDQDLLHQLGGAFRSDAFANALFENPGGSEHWVTLRLRGTRANSFGVGARIAVEVEEPAGARRTVHQLAGTGGSFGSSSLQQEIGLGRGQRIVRLTVRWPGSGTVQTFEDLAVNRIYRIVEGRPEVQPVEAPRLRLGGGIPGR